MSSLIYLDHNATTPVDDRVFRKMEPYLRSPFGNPSFAHPLGWDALGAVHLTLGLSTTESQIRRAAGELLDDFSKVAVIHDRR